MFIDNSKKGFSLLELLTVIVIVVILSTLALVALNTVRIRVRDTKRKADLTTIGKFLTYSCYTPDVGAGIYDLTDIITELKNKNEQYKQIMSMIVKDPKTGTDAVSNYSYAVTAEKKCSLSANLENENDTVTLTDIQSPTPGGGTGVFASSTPGVNGSMKYYQVSN